MMVYPNQPLHHTQISIKNKYDFITRDENKVLLSSCAPHRQVDISRPHKTRQKIA